ELVSGSAAGDPQLAFVGHMLSLLFTTAILVALRDRHYSGLPTWLLGVGLVVAAVVHPVLWNLSYPDIYVAAIAWGQACLVGGLLVAFPVVLGTEIDWRRSALAAVLWSLAIGSRYTLAPAVLVCVLLTAVGAMKSEASTARRLRLGVAIGLPFVLIVTSLGAYNFARFGRAAETGLQLQLTPNWDYTAIARDGGIFSVRYVAPNLIYYGVWPFKIGAEFPFLEVQRGESLSVRAFLRAAEIPDAYSVEEINGLLLAVPFSLFGLLWVVRRACGAPPGEQNGSTARPQSFRDRRDLERISLSMLLAAGMTGLLILAYRHVANRFMMDFSPFLIIPAVLGAWEFHAVNRGRPILGPLSAVLILVLAAASVATSILLGVGGPASRIDDYNPTLWAFLSNLGK
ncbi:MAG TPA: hypothetical protein VLL77_08025, partial [Anaerolineales bacterium]|nr:hypothetical protein [Anaerolineales bacterium]